MIDDALNLTVPVESAAGACSVGVGPGRPRGPGGPGGPAGPGGPRGPAGPRLTDDDRRLSSAAHTCTSFTCTQQSVSKQI